MTGRLDSANYPGSLTQEELSHGFMRNDRGS